MNLKCGTKIIYLLFFIFIVYNHFSIILFVQSYDQSNLVNNNGIRSLGDKSIIIITNSDSSNTGSESDNNGSQAENITQLIDTKPKIEMIGSASLSDRFYRVYSTIPRYNFHGHRVNDTTSIYTNPNCTDAQKSDYVQSVVMTASPFIFAIFFTIVILVISLIVYVLYSIIQFIKGRRRRSVNYNNNFNRYKVLSIQDLHHVDDHQVNDQVGDINSDSDHSFEQSIIESIYMHGLDRKWRLCLKIYFVIISLIFAMIMCLLLFNVLINNDLHSSIVLSNQIITASLNYQVSTEQRIINECKDIGIYYRIPSDVLDMFELTLAMYNTTNHYQQDVYRYESIRYHFVLSSIIIMFALVAFGFLSSLFKMQRLIVLFIITGLIFSIALWIVPSTHTPMSIVISDVCPQVTTIVEARSNTLYPYVQYFLECDNDGIFDFVDSILASLIVQNQVKLNYEIAAHYPQNQINLLEQRVRELQILKYDTDNILNCNHTSEVYTSLKNNVCTEILNGTSLLTTLFMIMTILFCVSFIIAIRIYVLIKRNIHHYNSKKKVSLIHHHYPHHSNSDNNDNDSPNIIQQRDNNNNEIGNGNNNSNININNIVDNIINHLNISSGNNNNNNIININNNSIDQDIAPNSSSTATKVSSRSNSFNQSQIDIDKVEINNNNDDNNNNNNNNNDSGSLSKIHYEL